MTGYRHSLEPELGPHRGRSPGGQAVSCRLRREPALGEVIESQLLAKKQ